MIEYNHDKSPLSVKSNAFSTRIVNMVRYIKTKYNDKVIEPILVQVLRSGTSIMANIGESQFAQSRSDFISKLHISLKEAKETQNWLTTLFNLGYLTKIEFESINSDCNEIISMLVSSLNTSKRNQQIVVK